MVSAANVLFIQIGISKGAVVEPSLLKSGNHLLPTLSYSNC